MISLWDMHEKNHWKIECRNTPETLTRILGPLRKRGLQAEEVNYRTESAEKAYCELTFVCDSSQSSVIFSNLSRFEDVLGIKKETILSD